jgi:hypothetical protein
MKFLKDNWEILFPIVFTAVLTIVMATVAHFIN